MLSRIPGNTAIRVDDAVIQPSQHVRNLGLYFDQHLVFEKHISEVTRKIFGTLMCINRIVEVFSKEVRTTLIQSLVLSIIYYGMAVWGTTNKTQVKRVQRLQNFCAKVAVGTGLCLSHSGWIRMDKC